MKPTQKKKDINPRTIQKRKGKNKEIQRHTQRQKPLPVDEGFSILKRSFIDVPSLFGKRLDLSPGTLIYLFFDKSLSIRRMSYENRLSYERYSC